MLDVEVTTTVKAPRRTVLEVYADYAGWPRLFPTISGVRLARREGDKLVLEVDHVEGKVVNELLVRPPDTLDLWEEKRRYDARFANRFEDAPGGTRFTVRGEIHLKGWARLLRPFLRGYVRRQIERLQLQPVKTEAEAQARKEATMDKETSGPRGGGGRPFPLTPTPVRVSDEVLDDLQRRLALTRWPDDAGNDDWYYGVNRAYLQELVDYWRTGFDWRKAEAAINAYEHYRVQVEGVPVHFLRRPGVGPDPVPLILTHGWPWTFWHWSKVIDPLADPGAYGGDPADAFEVIVPSVPGFGFSTPLPDNPDMNFWKVADLWHTLMTGTLGHERYGAGGCDVGALVTGQLGHRYAEELYAIHIGSGQKLTLFNGDRAWDLSGGRPIPEGLPADVHAQVVALDKRFAVHLAAHTLAPSTLTYGLSDSPAGLLAWILERWVSWSDNGGDVETVFTKDDLLTHAMIFWATGAIGTSIRTYANNNRYPWTPSHDRRPAVEAPTGITFVGYENPPGITTDQRVQHFLNSDRAGWYNHVNLTVHDHGGHFIPWEIPDQWVDDLRRTFRDRR